jgi:hypothetical protein
LPAEIESLPSKTATARRPANHPTPNTRFLNNIVRATNNHNRNLLAQERADSQARLDDLDRVKQEKQRVANERERRLRPGPGDTRKRILGDIRAIIGPPSKKRKANDGDDSQDTEHEPESESRKSRKLAGRHDDYGEQRRHSRHHHDHKSSRTKDRSTKELFADHGPKRGLAREEDDHEVKSDTENRPHRHRRSSRERSRRSGTRGDRSRERAGDNHEDRRGERSSRHHTSRRHSADGARSSHRRTSKKVASPQPSEDNSDSDPLDDIIGPKPPSPVRRRGRGAISGSGIEGRFASDYDPKTDFSLDQDEEDDWGSALEALRDRARWKQKGAERLRVAGFTDEQVTKWENGGEKNEEDVRWRKKGEEREWDRGKILFKGSSDAAL